VEFTNCLFLLDYRLGALIAILLDRGAAIIDHVALADLVGIPGSGGFVEVDCGICMLSLIEHQSWRQWQCGRSAGIGCMVGIIKMAHRT
jgi:hypothetical protein